MVPDVRMTGCKPVLLHVCARRCASGLSAALPPAGTIFFCSAQSKNICRLRRGERRAATRLVAGPEPLSSGMEWAREQVLRRGFTRFRKIFWRKVSKFLVGEENFSDPTSIIIRRFYLTRCSRGLLSLRGFFFDGRSNLLITKLVRQ